jgi:predicted DNA-binding protein (UPF0251 family)
MSKVLTLAPKRPARMSQKLRDAILLHVTEGLSIVAASERAGISRQGFHKALKRPEVRDYVSAVKHGFIEGIEAKKALLKDKALDVALDLMLNSKNEAIRARMVEFLAADAKVSPVAVHVDARNVAAPQGYVYRRPEQISEGPPIEFPSAKESGDSRP